MFHGIIRAAQLNDLSAIQGIYALYFKDDELGHTMEKFREVIEHTPQATKRDAHYLVAELDGNICGVLGYRTPHEKLIPFTQSAKPVELYSLFVSKKRTGCGQALVQKMTELVSGKYSEIVVYSNERWQESWAFYDSLGFERVGMLEDTSHGQVWRKQINV